MSAFYIYLEDRCSFWRPCFECCLESIDFIARSLSVDLYVRAFVAHRACDARLCGMSADRWPESDTLNYTVSLSVTLSATAVTSEPSGYRELRDIHRDARVILYYPYQGVVAYQYIVIAAFYQHLKIIFLFKLYIPRT